MIFSASNTRKKQLFQATSSQIHELLLVFWKRGNYCLILIYSLKIYFFNILKFEITYFFNFSRFEIIFQNLSLIFRTFLSSSPTITIHHTNNCWHAKSILNSAKFFQSSQLNPKSFLKWSTTVFVPQILNHSEHFKKIILLLMEYALAEDLQHHYYIVKRFISIFVCCFCFMAEEITVSCYKQ